MSERGVSESTQWALLIPVVLLVVLGTIQAGSSPELFPMLRKPQRRT